MKIASIILKNILYINKKSAFRLTSLLIVILLALPQIAYAIDSGTTEIPEVTSLTMFSCNADTMRAYQGDSITFTLHLKDDIEVPVDSLEIIFDGQKAELWSLGYGSYYGDLTIDDISPTVGYGKLEVNYLAKDGTKTLIADKTTNSSDIFLSDKTSLIEVPLEDVTLMTTIGEEIKPEIEKSICNIFDNNVDTYSEITNEGDGKNLSIIFDFKNKGVNLSRVELLSRQDENYSRISGVYVQGSYDGKTWKKISSSNASASNKWQILNITTSSKYRYIRVSSMQPWYGNLAELKLYSRNPTDNITEIPEISNVSLRNSGESNKKALPGDIISLRFQCETDIKYYNCIFRILLLGTYPEVIKVDDHTYEASVSVPDNLVLNELMFGIDYMPQSGQATLLTEETSDGSNIFITNETDMINLLNGNISFIDYRGTNNNQTLEEICNLVDNDENTTANFYNEASEEDSYIIFDFKEDGFKPWRIEILPRQDEFYESLENIDILASNDGENWESILREKAKDTKSWQTIYSYDNSEYRFIKLTNSGHFKNNIAELKLFRYKDDSSYYNQYVSLGTKGINNPVAFRKRSVTWEGNKVYFGQDNSKDSILWRVLNKEDDGSLFLFADDILDFDMPYNHKFVNTTWETSTLRSYLNGYIYNGSLDDPGTVIDYTNKNFINNAFSKAEISAIKTSCISTPNSPNGFSGGNDTEDKIFLLSLQEAINGDYGFISDAARGKADGSPTDRWWWLRTVGTKSRAYAATIDSDGIINPLGQNVSYSYVYGKGIRPALRIDSDSVLFSTYVDISKNKYSDFGSPESKVEGDYFIKGNWKLTLRGTTESLNAHALEDTHLIQGSAMNLNIDHKPASILNNNANISAMLVDEDNNILYYGKINDNSNSTASKITLPAGLKTGSYTLKVFAENINDDNITDYATEFSDINISINSGVAVEDIVNLPDSPKKGGTIVLEAHVTPERASFKHITYYLKDDGRTGATLKDGIITYENPGTISIIAVVKNGQLNGRPYTKEFTVTVENEDESEIVPDKPSEDTPDITPPEVDKPEDDVPDIDIPGENVPDTDKPSENTPDVELPVENIPGSDEPSEDTPDTEISDVNTPNINKPDLSVPEVKPEISLPNIYTSTESHLNTNSVAEDISTDTIGNEIEQNLNNDNYSNVTTEDKSEATFNEEQNEQILNENKKYLTLFNSKYGKTFIWIISFVWPVVTVSIIRSTRIKNKKVD